MTKAFVAQINTLPDDPALKAALEYLCSESNKLYNCTTYLARQLFFKTGKYDAVWVSYAPQVEPIALNPYQVLSFDHGLDNWLTCTSTKGDSFIIDGRHLKSLNQWYNKRVATIKEGKSEHFWCNLLDQITGKRNRQMRDAVNKATRTVIDHCLENRIGTLVFGWNKGQKQGSKMGKKNNQKFVQILTGKLKKRIEQMCEQYGIQFIEQEESYTSKASALDLDEIPVYVEKPEGWEPSGRRVKRGLYRSADGKLVNADCNSSWHIGREAEVPGMQCKPDRGVLTSPRRLKIWNKVGAQPNSKTSEGLKESPCFQAGE